MEFFNESFDKEVPERSLDYNDKAWKTSKQGEITTIGEPAETLWSYIAEMLTIMIMTIINKLN